MSPRLSRAEWIALTIGLSIAAGFFVHQWRYPSSLYDAGQYAEMGRNILDHGLRSRFMEASQVRTYGYPLCLSAIVLVARALHLPFVLALFPAQLGLYVLAAVALRRALAHWSVPAARVAFCGLLLNYYALLYTPESLTESLSISAAIALAAGWISAYRRQGPLSLLAALGVLAGFSVMIRPANIAVAATALVGTALIAVHSRFAARRAMLAAVVVAACAALPFLPQLHYNVTQFGRWTPLVARDLGNAQQVWGIQHIKYATAMPPSPEAAVRYVNPWVAGTTVDVANPMAWYVSHPRRGALTLAVHSFNLTDQDLLFTYSRDLDPWYRVPLGLVNHAVVALGVIGLVMLGAGAARTGSRAARDAVTLLLLALAGTWVLHAWTAVEMRFGALLLCALFPAAGYALHTLVRSKNPGRALAIALIVAAYAAGALRLSAWVREQSPAIRAVIASKSQPHVDADSDGDGVPNSRDRCPEIYAATPDGCPIPAPRSGDWSGDGAAQVTFLDTATGRAHAWTLRACALTDGRDLPTAGDPGWTIAGTSDLTGDGHADILWQNARTADTRLFSMAGGSKIAEEPLTPAVAGRDWRVVGTGDFDGDGAADIAWQRVSTGNVAIWFMKGVNGHAVFQSTAYVVDDGDAAVVAAAPWQIAGTTDFDADGHRDLVLEDVASGEVAIARLGARTPRGIPLLGRIRAGQADAGSQVAAIADFTGDGRDDVVLQRASAHQLALRIREGDGFAPSCQLDGPQATWAVAGPR